MVQVEHGNDLVNGIAIRRLHAAGGEPHGDDVRGDVGEVQVEVSVRKALARAGDEVAQLSEHGGDERGAQEREVQEKV